MARKASSAPNLALIAKKLGISSSTAFRALRNANDVGLDTRERVLQTARELGYVIPQRRSLSDEPRKHQIMVLSLAADGTDLIGISGMSRAAIPLNLMLLVHHSSSDAAKKIVERAYQPLAMQDGLVDGLVFLRRWPLEAVRQLSAITPAVSVLHHYPSCATDFVGIDDRTAMHLIIEHLLRGGYRRIGFFGLCRDLDWTCSSYGAYVEVMQKGCALPNPDASFLGGLARVLSAKNRAVLAHQRSSVK